MRTAISTITIVLTVMLLSTPVILAQDTADGDGIIEPGENPEEELAKAAQNPVADLISLPFQNNTNFGYGPDDDIQKCSISNRWSLFT